MQIAHSNQSRKQQRNTSFQKEGTQLSALSQQESRTSNLETNHKKNEIVLINPWTVSRRNVRRYRTNPPPLRS